MEHAYNPECDCSRCSKVALEFPPLDFEEVPTQSEVVIHVDFIKRVRL